MADYPFAGDLTAVGSLLRATEQHGEQRPLSYYQIIRVADGLAVGGAGFRGPPRGGSVEVGYGLAPSARGHGYAAEALTALLILAANQGVATVLADSTADNVPSQRTLASAGFTLVGADADLQHHEIQLAEPRRDLPACQSGILNGTRRGQRWPPAVSCAAAYPVRSALQGSPDRTCG